MACGTFQENDGSRLIRPRIKYGAGSAGTFSRREKEKRSYWQASQASGFSSEQATASLGVYSGFGAEAAA